MSDCVSLPNRERLHSFQQVTYLQSPDTNTHTHRAGAGAGIGNYTVTRQQMKQSMLIGLRGGREERGERRTERRHINVKEIMQARTLLHACISKVHSISFKEHAQREREREREKACTSTLLVYTQRLYQNWYKYKHCYLISCNTCTSGTGICTQTLTQI